MQKITPFLWFEGNGQEAVDYYLDLFGENAKVTDRNEHGEGAPLPAGSLLTATLNVFGHDFVILNAGPQFKFSAAISFMVACEDQAEVDRYWDKILADGGEPMACGWITDKFGVTWQITPRILLDLIRDEDPEKAKRAMEAMMEMVKLDLPTLEKSHAGV